MRAGLPHAHDWVAWVLFELTEQDAERLATGKDAPPDAEPGPHAVFRDETPAPDDQRVFLGIHNMRKESARVGCMTCETVWTEDTAARPCPGDPIGYKQDGDPAYIARDDDGEPAAFASTETFEEATDRIRKGYLRNDVCWCGSGLKVKACHGR